MKNQDKLHARTSDAENMENHQTWSQNQCKNTSQINTKTGSEQDEENHEQSCFSDV